MPQIYVPIRGMHCASCEILIGDEIKKIPGVISVKVSHVKSQAEVRYHDRELIKSEIDAAVRNAGYEVGSKEKLPWFSRNISDYKDLLRAAVILALLYVIAQKLNLFGLTVNSESVGVAVALFIGLVAGISTCMALIGGLVLSLSSRHAELHPEASAWQKFRPHLYFNLGRIAGYTFLGGFIGLLGKALQPSNNFLGVLTMVAGGVMIFFGLKLVEVFPVLHDKSITLPAGLARFFGLKKEVREYSHRSAVLTGALTFFLPCGFTQAMQIYAISTGSFVSGALVMGLFALGTSVGLLGIGGLTSVFKGRKARVFYMTAGLAVLVLGWFNFVNGSRLISGGIGTVSAQNVTEENQEPQIVKMIQDSGGYSPNTFTVEKGRPVKWIITSKPSFTCASSIVMPKYGISKSLRSGENIITFTPTEVGRISFSCSMGMYRGVFNVIDSGSVGQKKDTTSNILASNAGQACGSGGGCGGCGGGTKQPTQVGEVRLESADDDETQDDGEVQVIKTTYTYPKDIVPNTFSVKKGIKVKMLVDVQENGRGCMSTIMVPGLWETPEYLEQGKVIEMVFTPDEVGAYPITCAMGVSRGVLAVVN